jgi:hypothetical protein
MDSYASETTVVQELPCGVRFAVWKEPDNAKEMSIGKFIEFTGSELVTQGRTPNKKKKIECIEHISLDTIY